MLYIRNVLTRGCIDLLMTLHVSCHSGLKIAPSRCTDLLALKARLSKQKYTRGGYYGLQGRFFASPMTWLRLCLYHFLLILLLRDRILRCFGSSLWKSSFFMDILMSSEAHGDQRQCPRLWALKTSMLSTPRPGQDESLDKQHQSTL